MRTTMIFFAALVAVGGAAALRRAQVGASAKPQGADGTSKTGTIYNKPPEYMLREAEARAKPSEDARMRAQRLFQAGDIAGAEAECRKSLELAPKVSGAPMNPVATELMGEICLRQGKNREALNWFLGHAVHAAGGIVNINVAIAYCRLGDYQKAKLCYSDGRIQSDWKVWGGLSPQDLPGTATLATLEASALLTKGTDLRSEGRYNEAVPNLLAAQRLAPKNPLIAWALVGAYQVPPGDPMAVLPWLEIAATARTPHLREMAQKTLGSARSWFKQHPPEGASTHP